MDRTGDQGEIFEISDFTNASPWETFISNIEEVLTNFGLSGIARNQGSKLPRSASPRDLNASQKSSFLLPDNGAVETVSYQGTYYQLAFFNIPFNARSVQFGSEGKPLPVPDHVAPSIKEAFDFANDFPSKAHHITRWFGIHQFVLFSTTAEGGANHNEANLLLSSLSIAFDAIKCITPGFVCLRDPSRFEYVGYFINNGQIYNLKSLLYTAIPQQYASLSGAVELFKAKIGVKGRVPVSVATRYTYQLRRLEDGAWRRACSAFMLWGPVPDPVEDLQLGLTWYGIADDEVVPAKTPRWPDDIATWYLRCSFADSPRCVLSEGIQVLLQAFRDSRRWSSTAQQQISGDLAAMAEPSTRPPDLEKILRDMFSDRPPPLKLDLATSFVADMKSAPSDSLLAILAVHALRLGAMKPVLMLWFGFVREVRWCWHHAKPLPCIPVPPLEVTVADFSSCLLYQKLQMLNYCIAKKLRDIPRRQSFGGRMMATVTDFSVPLRPPSLRGSPTSAPHSPAPPRNRNNDSVPRETAPVSDIQAANINTREFTGTAEEFDAMREGAREIVPGLHMLANDRPVWSPETQDHGMRTEDMVIEQERLLESLGTSAEAAATRARLQSASLESDMAAFKAANPGATLEDFVRWHSPKDWIDETPAEPPAQAADAIEKVPSLDRASSRGKLSQRMLSPNNLWGQVWNQAKSCPISRQRPLFNVDVEAEKVLHYLETISPSELFEQLLRVLCSTIISQFSSITCVALPSVKRLVTALADGFVQQIGRGIQDTAPTVLTELLYELEVVASRASSLMTKFEGCDEIAARLLAQGEDLRSAKEYDRRVITRLFTGSDTGFFGEPDVKEFILRALLPRPVASSRRVANRMCVTISERDSEYRVATLLSLDE